MNLIKKIFREVFRFLGYSISKIETNSSKFTGASRLLELKYGHLESKISQSAVNAEKIPIPWFTYPSIEYFDQLDLSNKVMLEWGAGNSSLFFSKKVKYLYSIEHNIEWFEQVKRKNIKNQKLILEEDNYANRARDLSKFFDIILIDGIDRVNCSKVAVDIINKGGLIILDNSDRYPDIAENFRNQGFIEVDFHGLGPINDYSWTTSIFIDREFNIKPLTVQPRIPIGGGF
jgi:hypothetical protein